MIPSMAMGAYTIKDWNDDFRRDFKIPKRVKFFDAVWGRPARSKNGLFNAVLKALDPTIPGPYDEEAPVFSR